MVSPKTQPQDRAGISTSSSRSPKITTPGKSFDDWETKWTPGENIFSNFIDQVGLQRFHRLPRDGEARLVGKLVDVKQNDFQVHLEDGTVKEQLRNELVWIAINVKQHFNLYASAPVTDAIILYPFDVEGEDNYADADTDDGMGRDMIASTIHDIFQKEWAEKEGPLNGVQISIQIVNP